MASVDSLSRDIYLLPVLHSLQDLLFNSLDLALAPLRHHAKVLPQNEAWK